jgi:hypothetical protein
LLLIVKKVVKTLSDRNFLRLHIRLENEQI